MNESHLTPATGRQVGLLGGTFDPVHHGHLAIAQAAQSQLHLDEIWFVPAGHPWQKSRAPSSAAHRVAMLRLALREHPFWRIETAELERSGSSYAIDTLHTLRGLHPDIAYTWLMGADQLDNLTSWHRWKELPSLCRFAIAPRPHMKSGQHDLHEQENHPVGSHASIAVPAAVVEWLQTCGLDPQAHLTELRVSPLACASSGIRARLKSGTRIEPCLPPAVLHYLLTHQLY